MMNVVVDVVLWKYYVSDHRYCILRLVKVEDKRVEEPITLEAARPQIVRFLTYDQVRDILEKLRGSAKVELINDNLEAAGGTVKLEGSSKVDVVAPTINLG